MVASVVVAKGNSGDDKDRDKFDDPKKVEWAIKKVKKATEKYQDVRKAERDGYELASPYVPQMGYHYANFSLVDDETDALKPEVLVYAPGKNGKLKLVAVEYFSTSPSSLFGVDFDPPHDGLPFSLHAWISSYNPDGTFTDFNPRIPSSLE